jgi:magnesium-transporting ATPase (P-type)
MLNGVRSDENHGISNQSEEIKAREAQYGNNQRYIPPLSTFCELFKEALDDFILKILMVASVLSIAIEVGTASS